MGTTRFVQPCKICGNVFRSKERGRDFCEDCIPEARRLGPVGYDGYEERYTGYYGPDWIEHRQEILERDSHRCQKCGMSETEHQNSDKWGGGLHVHHIVPAREFNEYEEANDPNNLVTLCADCHRIAERNEVCLDDFLGQEEE